MFQLHLLKAGTDAVAFKYDLHRHENVCGGSVLDDVFIPDDEGVAPEHFVVYDMGGRCRVADPGGKGIAVNGAAVREAEIREGDVVTAGRSRLRLARARQARRIGGGTDVLEDTRSALAPGTRAVLSFVDESRDPVELTARTTKIGARPSCDLCIDAQYVSAVHCFIHREEKGYRIKDNDSTNHVYVNDAKVTDSPLPDGAIVRIGLTELRFRLYPPEDPSIRFQGMVGASKAMKKAFEELRIAGEAAGEPNVLVTGETGTGKEMAARAIHALSKRKDRPLVILNCAAIPRDLIESELFGHVKGAFTGAQQARDGLFTEADGGTLFLDEIGEMPVELQPKMLRAIAEGEVKKVGATAVTHVSVRIVAATNRDLSKAVAEGTFREDLLYRLEGFTVALPPLRDRGADVSLIADAILAARDLPKTLGRAARKKLEKHDWPGNVRELRNVLTQAYTRSPTGEIGPEAIVLRQSNLSDRVSYGARLRPGMTLEEIEKAAILDELARQNGHRERTAKALGIGVSTLRGKLKAWGVE
jgi:transcriptional regulator with AAA-type ATPase domain